MSSKCFFGDLMRFNLKKMIFLPVLVALGLIAILGQLNFPSLGALPPLIIGKELFAEEANISISIKPLTEAESEKYLKSDVLNLGYKPVQITVENQSSDPYLIEEKSISLPIIDSKKIASATKKASLPTSIGLKIAGFIFWPFSIPSTMHGIKSLQNYQKIKKDLWVKSIKEEIIPPYTTMNRVFFVETEDFKDSFFVTLVNQETLESKVFSVAHLQEEEPLVLDPIPMPEENYYLTHEK